jgi:transcriptional activator SPT7
VNAVIKDPMDLGTVTKKLKNSHYNSKQEFARDLYLIYDNCLEYNTDPASEYRKHANAMRRKTDRLLNRVPEIEVKERPEDLDESEDETDIVSRFSHFDNKRERSVTYESVEEELPFTFTSNQQYSGKTPMKGPTKAQEPSLTDIAEIENEDLHNELDVDKGELQNQLWRTITKKTRAKFTVRKQKSS